MKLTLVVDTYHSRVRFRELHSLIAGSTYDPLYVESLPPGFDASTATLSLRLPGSSDAFATATAFETAPNHPSIHRTTLALTDASLKTAFENAANAQTTAILEISDSTATYVSCSVPLLLRPLETSVRTTTILELTDDQKSEITAAVKDSLGDLTGRTGATGPAGADGADGLSAYELALRNGTTKAETEAAWLSELKGDAGLSAYELALRNGLTKAATLAEWLGELKGEKGEPGADSEQVTSTLVDSAVKSATSALDAEVTSLRTDVDALKNAAESTTSVSTQLATLASSVTTAATNASATAAAAAEAKTTANEAKTAAGVNAEDIEKLGTRVTTLENSTAVSDLSDEVEDLKARATKDSTRDDAIALKSDLPSASLTEEGVANAVKTTMSGYLTKTAADGYYAPIGASVFTKEAAEKLFYGKTDGDGLKTRLDDLEEDVLTKTAASSAYLRKDDVSGQVETLVADALAADSTMKTAAETAAQTAVAKEVETQKTELASLVSDSKSQIQTAVSEAASQITSDQNRLIELTLSRHAVTTWLMHTFSAAPAKLDVMLATSITTRADVMCRIDYALMEYHSGLDITGADFTFLHLVLIVRTSLGYSVYSYSLRPDLVGSGMHGSTTEHLNGPPIAVGADIDSMSVHILPIKEEYAVDFAARAHELHVDANQEESSESYEQLSAAEGEYVRGLIENDIVTGTGACGHERY